MDTSYTHITLDSQEGVPTPERGGLRFAIDSVLRNISSIEWLTFEVQENHALTIDEGSNALYFSEDLRCFKATLPHGSYTCPSLHAAIETAMCCATDVVDPSNDGPRNGYKVRLLQDSSRLCISSDGSVAFALHNFQDMLRIRSLRRLGPNDAQITVLHHDTEPLARGSLLNMYRPGLPSVRVQVQHAVGHVVLVHWSDGGAVDISDINTEEEGWTMQAIAQGTTLPELLGLGPKDLRSNLPIPVVHSSSPLMGNTGTPVDKKTMHVGVAFPHGCVEGDYVSLDGFEGGFLNGQRVRVDKVVSEQQMVVQVDARNLASFPRDQVLRFAIEDDKDYTCQVQHATVVQAQENTVMIHVNFNEKLASTSSSQGKWRRAKMLPPVPCKEWVKGQVDVKETMKGGTSRKEETGALTFRFAYRHTPSPEACIKRNAVVGMKKMNLLHNQSVLLMRLRVGMTEAYGITVLRSNNLRLFGRAQMKQSGFLASNDHSLVGKSSFHPPLERTSFLDVTFLTPQGTVVHPSVLGEYSLLLRIRASS